MPLKVLLYNDLVGVVTSQVTKMAVTPLDLPWPNHLLYANFTALSSIRPKLLPIKVFHCVNREFHLFIAKMVENIKYFIRTAKWIKMIPKHIFWPIIDCFSMYVVSRRSSPNRCVWSIPVTWQRWRSHHSIGYFWKPHAIRKLHDSIFYRSGVIVDWSFTLRE